MIRVLEGRQLIVGRETFEAGAVLPDRIIQLLGDNIPGTEPVVKPEREKPDKEPRKK